MKTNILILVAIQSLWLVVKDVKATYYCLVFHMFRRIYN